MTDAFVHQLPRLRACCAAHVRACRPVAPAAAGGISSFISSLACQALFNLSHAPSPRIPFDLSSSSCLPPHCCLEQRGGAGLPLGTTRAALSSGGCSTSASSPLAEGGPALPPALRALLPDALSGALTPMVAARVALPSKTRGVEMLSLLSPESAALWSSPKHLMLSAWEQRRKGIRPVTPFVGISPQEYPRYITRKLQADMVYLVHHSPGMIYNGVFGIVKDPKDNSIRDIIDARPFNCARGGVATPVHLPSPADLARLQFAPGERVVVGKMDISNYYHHIRTPRWMHRLCALPPLTPQQLTSMGLDPTGPCVPVCSTLCMGILDAVPIAQEISVRIARAACPSIRFLHELPQDTPVVMSLGPVLAIYLDDFAPIAAEQHSTHAQAVKTALQAGMEAAGFIVHITKDVAISPAPCDVIGCRISNSASEGVVMGPSPSRSLRLAARTMDFLRHSTASSKQLESLLGEWAWSLLAFRPLFSVFFSVYRFVRLAGASATPFSIWPSVRQEFFIQLALLPLLRARLSRPCGPRVYFTDASNFGGAVVSRPVSLPHVTVFPVDTSRVWEYPAHINALEFRSVLDMLGLAAEGLTHQLRVDSKVVLGILRKGRSSSWPLNHAQLARKAAGLQLTRGGGVNVGYVPSAVNPADGPSRGEGGTAALQRYLDEWL